ncbi:ROK family protein [Thorsellia anophelis]|uniref:N-acetyl-D-glucosamine kinase n=1 Tax=Thorsellia anophelis DSM 18579 TaxID=1123402 RepID=A0A1I0ESB9_9GAMM|nr:ROK family protein [Thorsellia anophelis]SET48131.1 N-acetylglucosamine kinase [Thorsellia anophelis DSM 18579]
MVIKNTQYQVGLDVGGTKIELAIFENEKTCIHSKRVVTPTNDYAAFLQALISLVNEADNITGQKIDVGIGLPAIISPKNQTIYSANVPAISGQPLAQDLSARLDRTIKIENDGRCFALSEASTENTAHFDAVFGVILGTGAGGGLVHQGRVYQGSNGMAGEWGHTPVSSNIIHKYTMPLIPCNCGLIGCHEKYLAGPGVLNLIKNHQYEANSIQDWIIAYEAGDKKASAIFTQFIDTLASALASLQLFYDVDAFVLGGGISNIKAIYPKIQQEMLKWLLPGIEPALVLPPVYGDSSGVRGAALLNRT